MKKLIKSLDLFGEPPQLEFSHEHPIIKTYCGSLFSLFGIIFLGTMGFIEFNKMFTREKKEYSSGYYSYNLDDLGEI